MGSALLGPIRAEATESEKLGSGNPGLKVVSLVQFGKNAIAIYQDEPQTVGNGLMGGYRDRHIVLLADQGYGFNQQSMDVNGLEQLYPFDNARAFTCSGGHWNEAYNQWLYEPRYSTLYKIVNGQIITSQDVQSIAQNEYHLTSKEVFLGFIDSRVFFWRSFDPSRVFWKKCDSPEEWMASMPGGIIDIYGATRGIRKDVGFVVFRKSPGLIHYSPYTEDFIELMIADGRRASGN
ncbi:MAG: hypothetical protein ACRDHZ_14220 [Ktedonobacteraceae bacterium]